VVIGDDDIADIADIVKEPARIMPTPSSKCSDFA
jgi:hypothetical protein